MLEEWRLGRGAGARSRTSNCRCCSRARVRRAPADRQARIIKNAPADTPVAVLQGLVSAGPMAVVAVGDFDKAEIQKLITPASRRHSEGDESKPGRSIRSRISPARCTDRDGHGSCRAPQWKSSKNSTSRDQRTVDAYRTQIVERLFSVMLAGRFSEITQKPDAPFLIAGASSGLFVRTKEAKR